MAWVSHRSKEYPETIHAGSPTAVSTETVLWGLSAAGQTQRHLRFVLRNLSANRVRLLVEHSEDGQIEDEDRRYAEAPAGGQCSIEVRDVMQLYWSASAMGDPDGGYPSSSVQLTVLGQLR